MAALTFWPPPYTSKRNIGKSFSLNYYFKGSTKVAPSYNIESRLELSEPVTIRFDDRSKSYEQVTSNELYEFANYLHDFWGYLYRPILNDINRYFVRRDMGS